MQDPYLLLFALLGWSLSIYFGFFRFRQYQWTRLKVQHDLFTRINQRSDQLFLKTTTLSVIRDRNDKVNAKHQGVLHKYLEGYAEKVLLIRSKMITEDMALFWLRGMTNELRILSEQNSALPDELGAAAKQVGLSEQYFQALLSQAQSDPLGTVERLDQLLHSLYRIPASLHASEG